MHNCPVARNWRQNTLRNFRSSWNLWLLLKSKNWPKHRAQLSSCLKLASKHSEKLSLFLKLATLLKKLNLVQNTVRNCPVSWNGRQKTLRNSRFAWIWRLLLKSLNLPKRPCATVLLLKFCVKTLCKTVVVLEIGNFSKKAKPCAKHCAQLSCCLKFGSKHYAQHSICLSLASFDNKLKLFQNTMRNCVVARNWRQKAFRNCRFAWSWRLLLKS